MKYWRVQLNNHTIVDYISSLDIEDLKNQIKEKFDIRCDNFIEFENFCHCIIDQTNLSLFFTEVSEKEYVDHVLN